MRRRPLRFGRISYRVPQIIMELADADDAFRCLADGWGCALPLEDGDRALLDALAAAKATPEEMLWALRRRLRAYRRGGTDDAADLIEEYLRESA